MKLCTRPKKILRVILDRSIKRGDKLLDVQKLEPIVAGASTFEVTVNFPIFIEDVRTSNLDLERVGDKELNFPKPFFLH